MRTHPAGYKIIAAVEGESVDKYIYGMYRSEVEPKIPRHSHSSKSFALLQKPIAEIKISSAYNGFEKEIVRVKAVSAKAYSKHIYEVNLVKDEGFSFDFAGYTHETQLGRFHSLTIDGKITRLYTSVNFLHSRNK